METTKTGPKAEADNQSAALKKRILTFQVLYVIGMCAFLISQGIFPSFELVFILVITALIWRAQYRRFIADFAPFLLLLLGYEALRGFAHEIGPQNVHVTELIEWERALCGGIIPSAYLQATLGNQPFTPLLNLVTNAFYMSHFFVPVVVAVLLLQLRREHYWPFMCGLTILSYAGFITYVLYPAAPPWWATYYGYLQDRAVQLNNFVLPTVLLFVGPNPVAAMPSLHAAYPAYIALYCMLVWGRKAAPMLLLPLIVSFSAVYLGHHYIVDILAGFAYAAVAFGIIVLWAKRKQARLAFAPMLKSN